MRNKIPLDGNTNLRDLRTVAPQSALILFFFFFVGSGMRHQMALLTSLTLHQVALLYAVATDGSGAAPPIT